MAFDVIKEENILKTTIFTETTIAPTEGISVAWFIDLLSKYGEEIAIDLIDDEVDIVWKSSVIESGNVDTIHVSAYDHTFTFRVEDQSSIYEEKLITAPIANKIANHLVNQLKWLYGHGLENDDNAWAQMLTGVIGTIEALCPDLETKIKKHFE
jgi:hypothetical protein